ncbi:hypothetical protein PIB30_079652 [Stylosanthes scabra]|uniref:Uncharacterized protein n=1 Tax=Stylosanthes scabra TaxID=79078 RepID=A0ABU6QSL0_9FABA|nr:hypothetical protein [Stylosanthes scabra]
MYEIAPSDTTVLAKSLADITSMLQEMKESQQATPKLLIHPSQNSPPPQVPPKHCGVCSCNSHYTDECPQLQEDNVIASSHNYYDGPPQKRQYQPQSQGQPYPSNNNSQLSYEEVFCLNQQENKKMREVAKRTEAQIYHLADLMTKFATQMPLSTSTPPPPPNPSPLPSQHLPNPKGGINVVEKAIEKKEKKDARTEWLIELIAKANAMVESDDEDCWNESEESDESDEEDSEEEEEEWEVEEEGKLR